MNLLSISADNSAHLVVFLNELKHNSSAYIYYFYKKIYSHGNFGLKSQ